ncbi:chaplin [Streptomyces sp. NPDC058308]|uniref:chaplin n=1 Tax=Streptomyces sp. NPDC058308 TaxID=3346440 RepID=UPI0036E2A8C5
MKKSAKAPATPVKKSAKAPATPVKKPVKAPATTPRAGGYGDDDTRDAHDAPSGATAHGPATHSPGAAAGNDVKTPADVPVKACGNAVGIVAALSSAMGNSCGSEGSHHDGAHHDSSHHDRPHHGSSHHDAPPRTTPHADAPDAPGPRPRAVPPVVPHPAVPGDYVTASHPAPHHVPQGVRAHVPAQAGAVARAEDQLARTGADSALLGAAGASAGLLLGGAILYRRGFAGNRR